MDPDTDHEGTGSGMQGENGAPTSGSSTGGSDGDSYRSEELLTVVYQALRQLARQRMSRGKGSSLVPTELVHEAYLRVISSGNAHWDNEGHFFSAAAEAMRRILVDRARAKGTLKRGEGRAQESLTGIGVASEERPDELLALDAALDELEVHDVRLAQVVKLRYFAGLSVEETAASLELTERTVFRDWATAKAWLKVRVDREAAE